MTFDDRGARAARDRPLTNTLQVSLARLLRSSRRRLLWRSLLTAPFVLSFMLALVLGPATINSVHGSFTWLLVLSLAGSVLMLVGAGPLLIAVSLAALLVFPPVAGLGFNFAPAWARPLVALIFYGSMLASSAALVAGIIVLPSRRKHRRALAGAGGGLVLLALAAELSFIAGAKAPVSSAASMPSNMGPVINTRQREAEPSFAADGQTAVFNCRTADICQSHLAGAWEMGQWSAPQLIGPPISSAYTEVEPWINAAGDKLYFNSTRPFARGDSLPGLSQYVDAVGLISMELGVSPFGGLGEDDIWVSYLTDGVWSEPRNLNDIPGEPPVNTAFLDHCLSFSSDGNEAFWTSTRPRGFGGDDIWTSRRVGGRWTEAENLGPNVNGPGSEHHSIPTPDQRSLYVTSNRAGGFGGEDIYISTRGADGKWGPLVNLGPLVNGPGSDRCPAWTPDLSVFLFDSDRVGGFGGKDIWWLPFEAVPGYPIGRDRASPAVMPFHPSMEGQQKHVEGRHEEVLLCGRPQDRPIPGVLPSS